MFNVVDGPGAEIGNALSAHPQVDMVSLTGSVEAGRQVMEAASANITKVSLELGGKAPAIVLKDADLDLAVNPSWLRASATPVKSATAPSASMSTAA